MAVYQLGLYGFRQLRIAHAAHAARQPALERSTVGIITPGASFGTASAFITTIRIEETGPDLTKALGAEAGSAVQVAADSQYGVPGARVDLQCRVVAQTDEAVPREVTFHILALSGQPQGLVGTVPMVPGVTYHVLQVGPVGAGVQVRDLAQPTHPPAESPGPDPFAGAAALSLTHGTLIDTSEGPCPVERLCPGDLVTTLANGSQPLRWVGAVALSGAALRDRPHLCPILIEAGALGNLRPLLVAPHQRVLVSDWRAQVYFGEDQVLIPATALDNGQTIRQVLPEAGVVYCHLLFDRHEVILAEGTLAESFHPGEAGMAVLKAAHQREIELLFPYLPVGRRRAAFPIVAAGEARALRLPG